MTEVIHDTRQMSALPSRKTAADILTEVAALVAGDRNTTHGSKEKNFRSSADLWNAYLQNRPGGAGAPVSPSDVALMLLLVKVSRSISGTPFPDHYADMAGYAAIAGELEQPA